MTEETLDADEQEFADRLKPISVELIIHGSNSAELRVHTRDYSAHQQNIDLLHEMEDHCGVIAENYRRASGHDDLYQSFGFSPMVTHDARDSILHIKDPDSTEVLKRIMIAAGKQDEIQDATMASRIRPDGPKLPKESGDKNSQRGGRIVSKKGEAE